MDAYKFIKQAAGEFVKLFTNVHKCKFLYMHNDTHSLSEELMSEIMDEGLSVIESGMKVLGGAIGKSDEAINELVREQVNDAHVNFDSIEERSLPVQHAMHILRICAVPKMMHVARLTPPSACADIMSKFDVEIAIFPPFFSSY